MKKVLALFSITATAAIFPVLSYAWVHYTIHDDIQVANQSGTNVYAVTALPFPITIPEMTENYKDIANFKHDLPNDFRHHNYTETVRIYNAQTNQFMCIYSLDYTGYWKGYAAVEHPRVNTQQGPCFFGYAIVNGPSGNEFLQMNIGIPASESLHK